MVRGWLVLGLAVGLMVSGCAAGETESPAEAFLSGASLEEGWVARLEPDQQLGYGGGFMNMLAVTDFGVVAVGGTCESLDESNTSADCTPAAWVSERGADWTKVYGQDAGLVEGTMFGVTAGGPGVVGVGSTCAVMPLPEGCAPAIWTSADGHVWEQAVISETEFDRCEGPDCQLYTVAATGSTLIAAGWDASGLGVWTSADGTEWSKTVFDPDEIIPVHGMDPEVPGEADFEHLLAFDGSVFAFGNATLFGYEDDELVDWWLSGAVWKTFDGISWTRADTEGSFGDGETWFSDITVWDDRIYIIGEECDRDWDCRHGLWSSSNGSDWAHYRFEDELESIIPQNISGARDSLIVTGVLNNLPVAATTLDVHTWQLHYLTANNLFGVSAPTNDLIQHNDQLIATSRDQINTWQP